MLTHERRVRAFVALFERTARGMMPTPAGAALALRLKGALAGLRAAELDFILGALRPAEYASDLRGEPLAEDELGIVCRRDHPWAKRKRIPARDLALARWVLPRLHTPNRMPFERALTARELPVPNVVVETSDLAPRAVDRHSSLMLASAPRCITSPASQPTCLAAKRRSCNRSLTTNCGAWRCRANPG